MYAEYRVGSIAQFMLHTVQSTTCLHIISYLHNIYRIRTSLDRDFSMLCSQSVSPLHGLNKVGSDNGVCGNKRSSLLRMGRKETANKS